jgi:hypothetical protein
LRPVTQHVNTNIEVIHDAEIILHDTPAHNTGPESQFEQVENEDYFHESKSTIHIDSDDGSTDEDSDVEMMSVSRSSYLPVITRQDREELRIVRNNFAEEYDPWDTSMVPEYADDVFRYLRELEVIS